MRKAITPVISIIILLLITISLAGAGWTYMSGYYEAMTAKQIKIVEGSTYGNEVMLMNIGTGDITQSDLRVLVNGKEANILQMTPGTLEPRSSARVVFEFSGLGQSSVRIIGPGNAITYSHDIEMEELQDLVSWWRFDGDGRDSIGGNHGSFAGSAHIVENAVRGRVLDLDGGGDYVDCGSGASLDLANDITIEAWVYPRSTTGFQRIFSKFDQSDGSWDGYSISKNTGDTRLYVQAYNNAAGADRVSSGSMNLDGWNHIAYVFSDGVITFYVNGNSETITGYPSTIGATSSNLYIGQLYTGGQRLNGMVDDVRIWNRTLTDNEIQALRSL